MQIVDLDDPVAAVFGAAKDLAGVLIDVDVTDLVGGDVAKANVG